MYCHLCCVLTVSGELTNVTVVSGSTVEREQETVVVYEVYPLRVAVTVPPVTEMIEGVLPVAVPVAFMLTAEPLSSVYLCV